VGESGKGDRLLFEIFKTMDTPVFLAEGREHREKSAEVF